MRLTAKWKSSDPAGVAELLNAELERAERDFYEIRNDTHVDPPRRFESRDGLMYARWWGTDNPRWRIGYTEHGVMLMVDFPDLKAVRQRRLSLLRWDSYVVNDTDREERWYMRVGQAASNAGLNPHEAETSWDVIDDFALGRA